jgi:ribokinase
MRILVFGSLNIDLTFLVDHIVQSGETISSDSLVRSAGGKGANQAAALAKAGMDVFMAGKIGRDGLFLLETLSSYGANTEYVSIYDGATGQALIQLDRNGQNAIVLYAGGNTAITLEEIQHTIGNFGANDLIVLQNEIIYLREIIETAKARGMKVCLNPSPYNEKIERLPLNLIDMFFVNEIEGAALAHTASCMQYAQVLDALTLRFPTAEILLTAGKEGAYYGFEGVREKGAIIDLPVVDTTGAGDTFTGYFIAARQKNYAVRDALAIACKASSLAVSRKGAMEAIPLAGEVF